ncbi:MAG TPA: type II toxin-antitoxin system HicB family antitoxin [Dehalococcoidia bacterium]
MHSYTVIVHEEEEGGYWAEVEELPGCFASGETLDELERDVKEAIEQHIAALKDIGQPIPKGRGAAEQGIRRWEIAIPA